MRSWVPVLCLVLVAGCGEEAFRSDPQATTSISSSLIEGSTDDRLDIYAVTDPTLRAMADGVPAVIGVDFLTDQGNGTTLWGDTHLMPLCLSENFATQLQGAEVGCTGFLIAPDLFATASHCVLNSLTGQSLIGSIKVIFGYRMADAHTNNLPTGAGTFTVNNNDIYTPVSFTMGAGYPADDWAVVRLDRPVGAVHPTLPLESGLSTVSSGGAVAVMGYSSAYPEKLSPGTDIGFYSDMATPPNMDFKLDGDFYGGNSGSPVIDLNTYKVQGLITGATVIPNSYENDYILNPSCPSSIGTGGYQSVRCATGACPSYARAADPLLPFVTPVGSPAPVNTTYSGVQVSASGPQVDPAGPYPVLAIRGADDNLYYTICMDELTPQNGCGYFNGWTKIQGMSTDAPPVIMNSSSSLLYFIVKQKGTTKLRYATIDHNTWQWSAWAPVGDDSLDTNDGPGVTFIGTHMVVMARDTTNALRMNTMSSAGVWSGWTSLSNGAVLSPPRAQQYGSNTAYVIVRGTDNSIYYLALSDNGSTVTASGWVWLGGATYSEPNFVGSATRLRALARGTDNQIYFDDYIFSAGGWTGWYQGVTGTTFAGLDAMTYAGYLRIYAQQADRSVAQAVVPFN